MVAPINKPLYSFMRACALCGGHEGRAIRQQPWQGCNLTIIKCRSCDLIQVDPMPDQKTLNAFYGTDYFCCSTPLQGGYENYTADEPQIYKTLSKRLHQASIKPSTPGSAAALDIGCATGVFLEVLRSVGWQAQGIELSTSASQRAVQKGFPVFQGDWRDASFSENTFELISLWDVIEHIPDPIEALRRCHRWLRPGGSLLISTPDASAWLAHCLGPFWLGFRSAGEHVLFFSRPTIVRLLEQAGFEVASIQAVGKYMPLDRVVTRLSYYTRAFRILLPFKGLFLSRISLYISSGDTMYVVARRR